MTISETPIMDQFNKEMDEFWTNIDSVVLSESEIETARKILERHPDCDLIKKLN